VDYLRRLHPSRSEPVGAARLDVPPRFAPGDAQPAEPAGEPLQTIPAAAGGPQPQGPRPQPVPVPASTARSTARVEPHQERVAPLETRQVIETLSPLTRVARPPAASALPMPAAMRTLPPAPVLAVAPAAAPPQPQDTISGFAPPAPPPPPGASLEAPLRVEALRDRVPTGSAADPAPVLHVTIDRIDVRLPPAPASAAPARKPRPSSAVAPLADYLRSGGAQ
jgi:hypothetical protein